MALSAAVLKSLIKGNIEALPNFDLPPGTTDVWLDGFCGAIASAIVTHITGAAVVNPGSMAITPGNIDAPSGVSGGPCTGNGSVDVGTGTVS